MAEKRKLAFYIRLSDADEEVKEGTSCIHCTVSESFVRVTKPAISGGILYTLIPRI